MSIIVPSNHTRIGAWVNSKMYQSIGEKSTINSSILYNIMNCPMQGYRTNTEDTGSLGYNSVWRITSRIGWVSLKGILQATWTGR